MNATKLLLSSALAVLFAACAKEPTPVNPAPSNTPTAGEHGHGPAQSLGSLTIGAHTFEVKQVGSVAAGKEAVVELHFPAGKAAPVARGWFGNEAAEGSVKAKFSGQPPHAHIDAPATLPAGSKLWIELEENGKTERGSLAFK